MHLSPREIEKLMLHQVGTLAQQRLARGLKLNYTEAVGLISSQVLEWIREGKSVADLMEMGKHILGIDDVMPGVPEMIHEVQVEGTFPDGSKLVTVHEPVCRQSGDKALALYGSGLTASEPKAVPSYTIDGGLPGEMIIQDGEIELNVGRETVQVTVLNNGDRPIQVGSHYPFFETNPMLKFDRRLAFGKRLNIAAGTAVRFEPGESKSVELVAIAGEEIMLGGNNIVDGALADSNVDDALKAMEAEGYQTTGEGA